MAIVRLKWADTAAENAEAGRPAQRSEVLVP